MKTFHCAGLGALGLVAAVTVRAVRNCRRTAKVLYGCEGSGGGTPYMTRRTLLNLGPLGKVCLHTFHRSDADVFHDHPFPFVTLVLKGGYFDVSPGEKAVRVDWLGPGAVRFRRARYAHRVSLISRYSLSRFDETGDGYIFQPATTLVWLGPRVREWGFHMPEGWTPWRDYFRKMGCKP